MNAILTFVKYPLRITGITEEAYIGPRTPKIPLAKPMSNCPTNRTSVLGAKTRMNVNAAAKKKSNMHELFMTKRIY